jgi:hypothetical protein
MSEQDEQSPSDPAVAKATHDEASLCQVQSAGAC